MCADETGALTFESLLTDPLVRLVMASDGVSLSELISVLEVAREAVAAREAAALRPRGAPVWAVIH